MKQFTYRSKNDHFIVKLNVYSPKEILGMIKANINKFKRWKNTPKNKQSKLFEFKIEKK